MEAEKHSGLGIASLIVAILSGIGMFMTIVAAGVVEASTPGGMDEESIEAMAIGLFLFGFLFTTVIALGLGIGGMCQSNRNKVFPILGAVFAAATLLLTIMLLAIGMSMD